MTFPSHTSSLKIDIITPCEQTAHRLNAQPHDLLLNQESSLSEVWRLNDEINLFQMIFIDRPHLFSGAAVFVTDESIQKQRDIITAIETVIALPAYQQRALTYAPDSAKFIPRAHSVFFGYDFHLTPTGPKLIEINTNAGGALLNTIASRTQKICFDLLEDESKTYSTADTFIQAPEEAFIEMFFKEWQAERDQQPLHSIAIVDENPQAQYMLPEFLLFKKLFEQKNIKVVICDPSELSHHNQALWHENQRIDLVYNRLTDFCLEDSVNKPLLAAYLEKSVVVTPNPRAHALYADKRNLTILTDEAALIDLGIDIKTRAILLNGIALTISVNPDDSEILWKSRKQLFFKPAKGYGSKAAYRGDKLTKRVFSEILQHDYVAQTLAQPSERQLEVENKTVNFKFDLRHYVYKGHTQLISARLYQGQTTNFRTPGGGFAQVVVVSCRNDKTDIA